MGTLSEAQIRQQLEGRDWRVDGATIVRELTLDDFKAAIDLVNRVASVAEQKNHHPDILIHGWNKVRVTLSTHSEGGITQADLDLSSSIDSLI